MVPDFASKVAEHMAGRVDVLVNSAGTVCLHLGEHFTFGSRCSTPSA